MRRIATLALIVPALSALAPRSEAQLVFPPSISSVSSTNAFDPGRVFVQGTNLGLVSQVLINGEVVQIVRKTATRIVVQPEPTEPGFGLIELRSPAGSPQATVELTPTVKATRTPNRMTITLHGGDVGTFVVYYSYGQLTTPEVVEGVYFHRLVDLGHPNSGILSTGSFPDSNPVTINRLVPTAIGLVGEPIFIQAVCDLGNTSSFTNLFVIPSVHP